MQNYRNISPEQIENAFTLIGKDWMLITAAGEDASGKKIVNTMTASWGGMGILWNKPVAFVFIRPQRYTFALTEQAERFSLSFLGEQYRDALRFCGTKSGKDTDKFAATGLTPVAQNGVPFIGEARLVLLCRKLYADDLRAEAFLSPELLQNYKDGDFHKMYVVEIEEALLSQ